MYKVEILTVVGSFIATTPEEVNQKIDIAGAGDYVANLAENGRFVELEDYSIVRFKDLSIIKGYRVFNDTSVGNKNPVAGGDNLQLEQGLAPGQIIPGRPGEVVVNREYVKYLGGHHEIIVLSCWDGTQEHFLLYRINGRPAEEFVAPHNFAGIVTLWLRQRSGLDIHNADVAIPHGTIDDQVEAMEYLKDYIKETASTRKPDAPTGKAYHGWNEDRGRGQ